jgi:hypothetical protein
LVLQPRDWSAMASNLRHRGVDDLIRDAIGRAYRVNA